MAAKTCALAALGADAPVVGSTWQHTKHKFAILRRGNSCRSMKNMVFFRRRAGRSSLVSKAENAEVAMAPPSSQQSRAQLMGAFSRHVQGKHSTSMSVVWFRCGEGGGCQGVLSDCIGGAGWPLNTMCCVCVHY